MRAIWVFLNVVLSVGVISIPILIIGWFDRDKVFTGQLTRFWAQWVLWATGIQYEISGLENIRRGGKYIFISNHESALDILLGIAGLPFNMVFLAKEELFKIPFFGWAMRASGMIRIDRSNPEKARKSVDDAVEFLINSKFSTLLYPEGTRSSTGQLLPFKKGGFILAIRSNLPVVPITILGSGTVLPKGSFILKQGEIKVIIAEPIPTLDMTVEAKDSLKNICWETISRNKSIKISDEITEGELHTV